MAREWKVGDEIREKAKRDVLVFLIQRTAWANLPTPTLEAVRETLLRCKADVTHTQEGGR